MNVSTSPSRLNPLACTSQTAVCESEQIAANNRGVSQWRPVRFADDVVFLIGQPADVKAFHAACSSRSPRARDLGRVVSHLLLI